jgi:hypothetical protein
MASVSSLPGPASQASRSAVQAALAEHPEAEEHTTANDGQVGSDASLEPGEIQEVDMQAQAETIRTVFSDPKNFNVKVRSDMYVCPRFNNNNKTLASTLFPMDAVVRFASDKGSELTANTVYFISSNAYPANAWRGFGLDGGYKAGHQF